MAEPCASCGAPLAADQRYCLECGTRRAEVAGVREGLGATAASAAPVPAGVAADSSTVSPYAPGDAATAQLAATGSPGAVRGSGATAVIAGVGVLLLAMGIGVLIGRTSSSGGKAAVIAPQVISVAPTGTGTGSSTPTTPTTTSTTPHSSTPKPGTHNSSGGGVGQVPSKPAPPTVLVEPAQGRQRPELRAEVQEPAQRGLHRLMPAIPSPPSGSAAASLRRRRDELAEQVAEQQWDLGGLAYEMAIRDHFRLDVLVRRAAQLQERDAELAEVERLLRLADAAGVGGCPSCGAPHSRGALFCWQCGATLMERAPSAAAAVSRQDPGERRDTGERQDTAERQSSGEHDEAAAGRQDAAERQDTLVMKPVSAARE